MDDVTPAVANFINVPEKIFITDDAQLNITSVKEEPCEAEDYLQHGIEEDSHGVDPVELDTDVKQEYSIVGNADEDLLNSGSSSGMYSNDVNQEGEPNSVADIDWKAALEKHSLTDPLLPSMNIPLHCILCAKQFIDRVDLQAHLELHFNENSFQCNVCGRKLLNKRTLNSHMKLHLERLVSCGQCDKKFHHKKDLIRHARVHTGEKPFQCGICQKNFHDKSTLNCHVRVHTGEKPFACKVCTKSFSQKASLRSHYRLHTDERPYECGLCKKTFHDGSTLRRHTRAHTGEKPFQCGICQKFFYDKSTLNCHIRVHTGIKPFQCHICSKNFTQRVSLRSHIRLHNEEKPYECLVCRKNFHDNPTLKRHSRVHTGEKPFKCSICVKSFTQKVNLRNHLKLHTDEQLSQLHQCVICKERFIDHSILISHMRIHIPEGTSPNQPNANGFAGTGTDGEPMTYKCQVCNEDVNDIYSMIWHIRVHASRRLMLTNTLPKSSDLVNETPSLASDFKELYQCDLCAKSFGDRNSFITHWKTHTFEEQNSPPDLHSQRMSPENMDVDSVPISVSQNQLVQCDVCNKNFPNKISLIIHSSSHSSQLRPKDEICPQTSPEEVDREDYSKVCVQEEPFYGEQNTNMPTLYSKDNVNTQELDRDDLCKEESSENINVEDTIKTPATSELRQYHINNRDSHDKRFSPVHLNKQTAAPKNLWSSDTISCETSFIPPKVSAFQCPICKEIVADSYTLLLHLKTHTQGTQQHVGHETATMKKQLLGSSSETASQDINLEYIRKENTEEQLLQCNFCKDKFTDKATFYIHLSKHIQGILHQGALYPGSSSVNPTPEDRLKPTADQQLFRCDFCNESFTDNYSLLLHLRTHTEPQETRERDNRYPESSPVTASTIFAALRRNIEAQQDSYDVSPENLAHKPSDLKHTNKQAAGSPSPHEIPFISSFKEEPQDSVSYYADEARHRCTLCVQSFCDEFALHRHLRTHTNDDSVEKRTSAVDGTLQPYTCEVCAKLFSKKSALISHMKAHRKKFQCSVCPESFTLKSAYENHCSLHTGTKPYQCYVCHKMFAKMGFLRKHLQRHSAAMGVMPGPLAESAPSNNARSNILNLSLPHSIFN